MKELTMQNGDVQEANPVCHRCQQPNPDVQAITGEHYHRDCAPAELL